MEERKLCEDCGTKLAPDATSCPTCGLNLEAQADWEERVSDQLVEESFPLPPEHARSGEVDGRRSRRSGRLSYGGFWIRVAAYLLDSIVTGAIGFGSGMAMVIVMETIGSGASSSTIELYSNLLGILIGWLYFAGLEGSSMQATLGKKLVNLKVCDLNGDPIGFGRATGRYFAKILSAIVLLIGFIMVGFTQRKQGLHDMIAGTLVVKG